MKSPATTVSSSPAHEPEFPFTRGARVGLFLLTLFTICFASGVLFVRFQLESFRSEVEHGIESRFGAHMTMGEVSVNGLRGIRIESLRVVSSSENGPSLTVSAPSAIIDINLSDLLYGALVVDRIVLDEATVVLERPEEGAWYSSEGPSLEEAVPFQFEEGEAFRITGARCRLEIRNIVGDTKLEIYPFRFDIARLVGADVLTAHLEGDLSNDPDKHVSVKLNLASLEDFDLHIQTDLITAEDVNVILPAPQDLVIAGTAHPNLWVNGRPGKTLLVSLQAPFEGIVFRDNPEFIEPATGTLTLFATYEAESRLLSISTAKAESDQLSGSLDGTVLFTPDSVQLDLNLHATRIPVDEVIDYLLEGRFDEYGEVVLALEEPHEVDITLRGPSGQLIVNARASSGSGRFEFIPGSEDHPSVGLDLGQMTGTWNSETQDTVVTFDVVDGFIRHGPTELEARKISGTVAWTNDEITVSPFNATITENAFVGSARYDLASGDGELSLEGTFARLEDSIFADIIADMRLVGAAKIKGRAVKRGDQYRVDGDLDITQAQLDYQWWFRKPTGVGASGRFEVDFSPWDFAKLSVDAEVASSNFVADVLLGYTDGPEGAWFVRNVEATSDKLDLNAVAACLRLPYRITGGTGYLGHFEYSLNPYDSNKAYQSIGYYIDNITVVAEADDAEPFVARGVSIEVAMETLLDYRQGSTGTVWLDAQDLSAPALDTTWFVAPEPPPEWRLRDRSWSYALASDAIELPPWIGTDFTGQAFSSEGKMGLNNFRVSIDDGQLSGNYFATRADNSYTVNVNWTDVPAHYFLEHLNYPLVLRGAMSGSVNYSLDRDDPGTLAGNGYFEVEDGKFSADFLYSILEGNVDDQIGVLPPDLNFNYLYADVELQGYTVKTPRIKLESETIQLDGAGEFTRDADMDYRIRLAVDPDAAERIPLMVEYFNVQGHRLSNQDIKLAFEISGPTFHPRGELAELPPARVTLISGALEVTREAIDFPRKILKDLLKMGGGIVGPGLSD